MTATLPDEVSAVSERRDVHVYIGHHIRHYRERLDMTQADLGCAVERATTAISHWENATRMISVFDLLLIAEALGVAVTALLPRGGL